MTARLLADGDLNYGIVRGLRRRAPAIDFLASQGTIPDALPDPLVLRLAAELGRVLVSHDMDSMPGYFYHFILHTPSPGLILIPQERPLRRAIDDLEMTVICMPEEEFQGRIVYL